MISLLVLIIAFTLEVWVVRCVSYEFLRAFVLSSVHACLRLYLGVGEVITSARIWGSFLWLRSEVFNNFGVVKALAL